MITLDSMTEEQKEKRERFYNFYSPEVIKLFSELFDKGRKEAKAEEFYQYYENIINKSARLLREIGAVDPLTATAAIQYLLWNGYFSKDNKLVYGPDNRVNHIALVGADVVFGRSVCLNNAGFEVNVLRALGQEAYVIGSRLNPKDTFDLEYRPNINRSMDEAKFLYKLIVKLMELTPISRVGNHAVTLVKTEGQFIISDPTNLAYANIDDFMQATYAGSSYRMELKPWIMLALEGLSIEKFKEIVESTLATSDKALLNTRFVKQVYENGIYLCKRNIHLLEDFHEDITPDIETVNRTLVKKKRN